MENEDAVPAPEKMFDAVADAAAALRAKLDDAMIPGFAVEFDPGEAAQAGAFAEHALSEADAVDSAIDLAGLGVAPADADGGK